MRTSITRVFSGLFGSLLLVLVGSLVKIRSSFADEWVPLPRPSSSGVQLDTGYAWGLVPPFRAAERDRLSIGVEGWLRPAPQVLIDGAYEGILDHYPDGSQVGGSGDLRLGTALAVVQLKTFDQPLCVELGWRVKLPNAADEGELGSDEADTWLYTRINLELVPATIVLAGGVTILGNPTALAAQDDVLWAQLSAQRASDRYELAVSLAYSEVSPWNPPRGELLVRAGLGEVWRANFQAGVGLTAASPTGALRAGLSHLW